MSLLRRFPKRLLPQARDWRTSGHPPPPSLLDDHPDPPDLTEPDSSKTTTTTTVTTTTTPPPHLRTPPDHPTPPTHAAHRASIRRTFPSGWSPPRKLSREAMDGLRLLHRIDPTAFSTPVLADRFRISPEAVRRILKSNWAPSREEQARYARRERQKREETIQMNIMEERVRAMEIERKAYQQERGQWPEDGGTRVRGVNAKDRFTFQ